MADVGKFALGAVVGAGGILLSPIAPPLGNIAIALGLGLISEGIFGTPDFQEGIKVNTTSSQSPLPVVYGQAKIGHSTVDIRQGPSDNDVLNVVAAICVGSENGSGIFGVSRVDFGNEVGITNAVANNTSTGHTTGNAGLWQDADGNDLFSYNFHTGTDTQSVDAIMNTGFPTEWPTTSTGKGIAYFTYRMIWDDTENRRWSGVPSMTYIVNGNRVYDPRDPTGGPNSDGFSYTKGESGLTFDAWNNNPGQNPALVLYDYLTSKKYGVGLGTGSSIINDQSFIDGANHCDESVTVPDGAGGTESQARYTINGALSTGDSHKANIEKILSAMNANLIWANGEIQLMIRKTQTAETFEFTEDNILGNISITRSGTDTPNTVRARYPDEDAEWDTLDVVFPEVGTNSFLEQDNDWESEHVIDLPLTTNIYQAQQLAQLALEELREDTTVSLTSTEESLALETGDVVRLTYDSAGWTQKEFRVMSMTLTPESTVEFALREYDSGVYTLDTLDDRDPVPGTDLPDPFTVAAPTGLTLTSDDTTLIQTDDGTVQPRVKAEWTRSTGPFIEKEVVSWNLIDPVAWNHLDTIHPGEDTVVFTPPLSEGTNVDIRVVAYNTSGRASTAVTDSITATGKATPPADVTGLTLKYNTVFEPTAILLWNNNTDNDLSHYEVRYGGTGWADATVLAERVDVNYFSTSIDDIGVRSTTFRVKALDRTGNYSTNAATVAFSDPAPTATTPTGIQNRNGFMFASVDVTGADATGMHIFASTTPGFTPSDSNLKGTSIWGNNATTSQKIVFGIEDGWDGQTIYMRLGFFDKLTEVLSESVVLSTEFNETGVDPDTGTDTVVPLVFEEVTESGGNGEVALTIQDSSGYVNSVGFKTYSNGTWSGWTDDTTVPYTTTETVPIEEKHNTAISWRVGYDLGDGNGQQYISSTITFDADEIPELTSLGIDVDDSGNVEVSYVGDDDVGSIRWDSSTSSYPTAPTGGTGGTPNDGRTDTFDPGSLTEGQTRYVTIVAYSGTGGSAGTGAESTQSYQIKTTYRTDTDTTGTNVPTVTEDISYDGSGNATVTLTINDPDSILQSVEFRDKEGSLGSWSGWSTKASPYTHTVALSEKHDFHVQYRITYTE